jgi:hypothetical protein
MKTITILFLLAQCLSVAAESDETLRTLHANVNAARSSDEKIQAAIKVWDYLDGALPKLEERVFLLLQDDATKKRFGQSEADWKNFRISEALFAATAYRDEEMKRLMHILTYIRVTESRMTTLKEYCGVKSGAKEPNQSLEPTTTAVTPPAPKR